VQELAKYTGSLLKDQPDFLADCTNKIKIGIRRRGTDGDSAT